MEDKIERLRRAILVAKQIAEQNKREAQRLEFLLNGWRFKHG